MDVVDLMRQCNGKADAVKYLGKTRHISDPFRSSRGVIRARIPLEKINHELSASVKQLLLMRNAMNFYESLTAVADWTRREVMLLVTFHLASCGVSDTQQFEGNHGSRPWQISSHFPGRFNASRNKSRLSGLRSPAIPYNRTRV
jgi:hypothetical protein